MAHFSAKIDQEFVEKIFVSELIALSDDLVNQVRMNTVKQMKFICKHVSGHVFESKLMQTYMKLSRDTVWGVRREAVAILPDISELCSASVKETALLIDLYKMFAQDNSKWVKNTCFEFFGPFIVTLKGSSIDTTLIKHFLSMGDPRHSGSNNDNTFNCAFNFPAVVFTLGPDRWDELKHLYFTLIRDA
jgi:serine/threonine-protein phosphatase 4 regulatory subunit 1